MFDRLFFLSLLLSVTGLFRFVAPQFNVPISAVSLFLLSFNMLYVFSRGKIAVLILPKYFPWIVFLFVWPVITLIYSPGFEIRQIGVLLSNLLLFFGASIFCVSAGSQAVFRLFLYGILLTAIGIFLNMAVPHYFEGVGRIANANHFAMNRPGGFFMQPNGVALGLSFMFLGALAFSPQLRNTTYSISMVFFLGLLLLTGSRTGIVVGISIVFLYFSYHVKKSTSIADQRGFASKFTTFIFLLVSLLIGMKIFIAGYSQIVDVRPDGVVDRISNMLEFRLVESGLSISEDASVLDRLIAQNQFINLILEKPILGHGFGSEAYYLDTGTLYKTAHSTILLTGMSYGIFYPIAFIFLLGKILIHSNRKRVEALFDSNAIQQLVIVCLLLFAYTGDLFDRRSFLVLLGVLLSMIFSPSLFNNNGRKIK